MTRMNRLARQTGHPCKLSLSLRASDEGAFIATPLEPPASLSLFPPEASCRAAALRGIRAAYECSCRTLQGEKP